VERLQQRSLQQLLGWNRSPAICGVQRTEGGIQSIKGLIRQFANPQQRVTGLGSCFIVAQVWFFSKLLGNNGHGADYSIPTPLSSTSFCKGS
jgi:hypothetical protein